MGESLFATQIDPLTPGDIEDADAILVRAFGVSRSFGPRLRRYLAMSPGHWLALRTPERLVGLVGANVFPGCAYIGLMAVAPEAQRRGHGEQLMRALLAHLDDEGHVLAVLDASDQGAPLYERLGFSDGPSAVQWDRPAQSPPPEASLPYDLFGPEPPPEPLDLRSGLVRDEVIALDAACFGHERRALWERLAEELPRSFLGTRNEGGALTSYLCVQSGLAGPWGALTPAAATSLLRRAFSSPALADGARVLVSCGNHAATQLLRAAGFRETRRLRHMRRHPSTSVLAPVHREGWPHIYGKGSFCLG